MKTFNKFDHFIATSFCQHRCKKNIINVYVIKVQRRELIIVERSTRKKLNLCKLIGLVKDPHFIILARFITYLKLRRTGKSYA
jgi:hypothetical protein